MNEQHDGGPAFSRPAVFTQTHGLASAEQDGMTLRDYFAAKAMQGYVSDEKWRDGIDFDGTAGAAYAMADAMLKARNT